MIMRVQVSFFIFFNGIVQFVYSFNMKLYLTLGANPFRDEMFLTTLFLVNWLYAEEVHRPL
jgi:hypothetical protein